MRLKFGLTFAIVIILAAVTFIVVGFEAESGESILTQQHDLCKERSLGLQYYQMDVEIITRASDGSRANVETYSMRLMGKPGNLSAGKADRWTCAWFVLKIGEGSEVTVPSMEGWS